MACWGNVSSATLSSPLTGMTVPLTDRWLPVIGAPRFSIPRIEMNFPFILETHQVTHATQCNWVKCIYFLPPARPVSLLKMLQMVLGDTVPNALLEIKFIFLTMCLVHCPMSSCPPLNINVAFLTLCTHKIN